MKTRRRATTRSLIRPLVLALLIAPSFQAKATIVSIGSFSFDDSRFAVSAVVAEGDGNVTSRRVRDRRIEGGSFVGGNIIRRPGESVQGLIGNGYANPSSVEFAQLGTATQTALGFTQTLVNGPGTDLLVFGSDLFFTVFPGLPVLTINGVGVQVFGTLFETVPKDDLALPDRYQDILVYGFDLASFGLGPGEVLASNEDILLGVFGANLNRTGNFSGVVNLTGGAAASAAPNPATLLLAAAGLAVAPLARRRTLR